VKNRTGIVVLALLVAGVLSVHATGQQEAPVSQQRAYEIVNGVPKYDPPITLTKTLTIPTSESETWFQAGGTPTDNAYTQWARETLGIIWKAAWIAPDDQTNNQRISLAAAANDLPNVIEAANSEIHKLARGGQLMEVESLLVTHGSDLTQYLYFNEAMKATNDRLFLPVTYQGQAYAVPRVDAPLGGASNNHFIRKDVLDELGLEVPSTLSEFEDTLKAVADAYPSMIPFYIYSQSDQDFIKGVEVVTNAYGAAPGKWIERNGQLAYGSIQPEVKLALEHLARWYADGLIDPEFITNTQAGGHPKVVSGNVFSLYSNWWFFYGTYRDLAQNVDGASMYPVPVFEAPGYEPAIWGGIPLSSSTAISVGTENPEALIFELNEKHESGLRNDKDLREKFEFRYPPSDPNAVSGISVPGPRYFNFSDVPEGVKLDHNNAALNSHAYFGIDAGGRPLGGDAIPGRFFAIRDAIRNDNVEELTGLQAVSYNSLTGGFSLILQDFMVYMDMWEDQIDKGLYRFTEYQGPPTESQSRRGAYLLGLEQEAFARIVTGSRSIDHFDEFVQQWLANGGSEITDEVNAWYESVGQ
jgi:putative aldouronate transport system substrate-binding protein